MKDKYSDQLMDAASKEALDFATAKRIANMTYAESFAADELIYLLTQNGEVAQYNEKYFFRSFRIKVDIYRKYIKYCTKNKLNILRFINEILSQWLDEKQIREQDKIEREAHDGA